MQEKNNNFQFLAAGFGHMAYPKLINVRQMRLCFQVFLTPDPDNKSYKVPIKPVVSDVISDKKRTKCLRIYETSDNYSPAGGNKKIMILCDRVNKEDIEISFYEKDANNSIVWQDRAKFQQKDVHAHVAVAFRTPKYVNENITKPVKVFFRLELKKGGVRSNPVPFEYVPENTNIEVALIDKRAKIDSSKALFDFLQDLETENGQAPKMSCDMNVTGAENITPADYYFGASNYCAPTNHSMPTQLTQPQYNQYNNQQQQHYQSMNQFNAESNFCGNFSSPTFGNANGTNMNANNLSQCGYHGQPHGNNQHSCIVHNNQVSMNHDSATHQHQQMAPIYTADTVIIQQFCNNTITFNQPQQQSRMNGTDAQLIDLLASDRTYELL